jgi:hypothetical protein
VAVALLNLVWVPVVLFAGIAIPDKILTIPIIAAFAVSILHFVALYRARVTIPVSQTVGAVLAAMSVQWTVARAVGTGLVRERLPFLRTAKGGSLRSTCFAAFWEGILAALLVLSAVILVATNQYDIREINLFALVLIVQSLPFMAALAIAALERSRVNEFATWRSLETRLAELVLRRAPIKAPAAVAAPAPAADKRIEAAQ